MTLATPLLTWPGRTNEEWRRSSLSPFALETLKPAAPSKSAPKALPRDAQFAGKITFVDGVMTGLELDPELKKKGVVFGPHSDAPELVKKHLALGLSKADTLASSGHYSRIEFGLVLSVPAKVVIEVPFLVELVENRSDLITVPHFVMALGEISQSSLVFRQSSPK